MNLTKDIILGVILALNIPTYIIVNSIKFLLVQLIKFIVINQNGINVIGSIPL